MIAPLFKKVLFYLGSLLIPFLLVGFWGWWLMIRMPGVSYEGSFVKLSQEEQEVQKRLQGIVKTLAGDIGDRSLVLYKNLTHAEDFIAERFRALGYTVHRQSYKARGKEVANLEAELAGKAPAEEIVVIGAHYDTAGNPGADDNASGVAALLELARLWADRNPGRTIRFVAFVNEETPYLKGLPKGSRVYAQKARKSGEAIEAMISLEMLGYYSKEEASQRYPFAFLKLFYPSSGDFIAFVGNLQNAALVRSGLKAFRGHARFPSEGIAMPGWIEDARRSDHASFWEEGYPAIMVTDTAQFRNPHYHSYSDTPETLDYKRMARVVMGLNHVLQALGEDSLGE